MKMFIDAHRNEYGVEPICGVLPIAPSTYRAHAARLADPSLMSERAKRDASLRPEIQRVWEENFEVYGARKVWRQLNREGIAVARCTVARLMAEMGLAGAVRGKPVKTTVSHPATPCPEDRVNRQFHAPRPNALWLSDFTYVATWAGFVYVAFVIDAFARRVVGWRASRSMQAELVLDALEQALHARRPVQGDGLIHHSDRGSQYVSIKYTERLAEAGIEPSVGSVGDSYDNALADRSDPSPRPLAEPGSGRIRNPGMGRLVQQPPPARTHRQRTARRSRGALLCGQRRSRYGRVTQTKQPPANPVRFSSECCR
jgi:transposase InsO family protein